MPLDWGSACDGTLNIAEQSQGVLQSLLSNQATKHCSSLAVRHTIWPVGRHDTLDPGITKATRTDNVLLTPCFSLTVRDLSKHRSTEVPQMNPSPSSRPYQFSGKWRERETERMGACEEIPRGAAYNAREVIVGEDTLTYEDSGNYLVARIYVCKPC